MNIKSSKTTQKTPNKLQLKKGEQQVTTGPSSKERVKGKRAVIKLKPIQERHIESSTASVPKSQKLSEGKELASKKAFEDALETFRLHGSTQHDIDSLRDEFSTSVEKMIFLINYVEERKIEEAFEDAFKNFQELCPNLHEETLTDLRTKFTSSIEQQKVFIEKVKGYLEEKKIEENQGWGSWLFSGPKRLQNRAVQEYQKGAEQFANAKAILGNLADDVFKRAQERVAGSIVGQIGENITNIANASYSLFGNITLGAATSVLPFMTEWGVKFLAIATGVYDSHKPEETAEEAQKAKKAVDDYLRSCKVSDRAVQNLSGKAISTASGWLTSDAILAYHGGFSDIPGALATLARSGVTKFPEYALNIVLTAILMDALGPTQVPDFRSPGQTVTQAGLMTPAQVWVLASCLMTIIKTGSAPVKDSLISFFLESTLLAKVIFVQKLLLSNLHPVPFFPVRYLTAKAIDDFVRTPAKGLIKGGLNIALEAKKAETDEPQKKEIEQPIQTKEIDEESTML